MADADRAARARKREKEKAQLRLRLLELESDEEAVTPNNSTTEQAVFFFVCTAVELNAYLLDST